MEPTLRKIIERLLKEVDPDIREAMLEKEERYGTPAWASLHDPTGTILAWQALRDRKKQ